ncbi:transcription antitermination factor NusB [Flavobacteriaceae bacterium F08102]|nr:transcription antitermination factor NusB [Flavobacteriaceae bacterium F08102]
MLNRRHIRVKVMQSVYAVLQSKNDDLVKSEKFLHYNISRTYDLYVLMLDLMLAVRDMAENHQEIAKKKHLATAEDKNPVRKFVDHPFLLGLKQNTSLEAYKKDHKLNNWKEDSEYVRIIWEEIKKSPIYIDYITTKEEVSKKEAQQFIEELYKTVIAPNDKLLDYLESNHIGWIDDIPYVNTWLLKNLKKITSLTSFNKDFLYKDKDDQAFTGNLFKKVCLHQHEFDEDIDLKTPNWDADRIAEVDLILIKMALVEFVYFPSIPTRVSINEYLEISKDYSTEKSSFFINGVLDKLLKDFDATNRFEKIGRGLL